MFFAGAIARRSLLSFKKVSWTHPTSLVKKNYLSSLSNKGDATKPSSALVQSITSLKMTQPVFKDIFTSDMVHAWDAANNNMPRYPSMTCAGGILRGLDYFGTGIFAVSGSITAATLGMDSLGCVIVGTVTAIGGGTIRDVFILNRAAFWTIETEYLAISAMAALGAFLSWPLIEPVECGAIKKPDGREGYLLQIGDSVGVGAFATIGAMNSVRAGCAPVVCAICGMVTATFGGLTRDVLSGRPGRILHSFEEIYAMTALGGASTYVILNYLRTPLSVRIFFSLSTAVALRAYASSCAVKLPYWDEKTRKALASNVEMSMKNAKDEQRRFAVRMFGGQKGGA